MSKRLKNEEIVVNHTTGEVLTISKSFTIPTNSEEFFLLFLKNLGSLYELKNATEIHVLAFLCANAKFNTNEVSLSTAKRNELMAKLKIRPQSLTNAIRRLRVVGLLTGDKGEYTVNPLVMWKGSIKERDVRLKDKGLSVMIKFENKPEP